MALVLTLTALTGVKSVNKALHFNVAVQNTSGSDATLTSLVISGKNFLTSGPIFMAPGTADNYPTIGAGLTVNYGFNGVPTTPYGPDDAIKADVSTTLALVATGSLSDGAIANSSLSVTVVPVLS